MGTEFNIYDHGKNPTEKKVKEEEIRKQLGGILYESNLMGSRGPRKMQVLLPQVTAEGEVKIWKPKTPNDHLVPMFKGGQKENMIYLINKPPKWNEG